MHKKHKGGTSATPIRQVKQFWGQTVHLLFTKLDPFLHWIQIEVLVLSHSRHESWAHLKQVPETAVRENGNLHVRQNEELADVQVKQGYAQSMQVDESSIIGGLQAVQFELKTSQRAQLVSQGVQVALLL